MEQVSQEDYQAVLHGMKLLKSKGAEVMRAHGIRCATDITGFGLLGHVYEMASDSGVTFLIRSTISPKRQARISDSPSKEVLTLWGRVLNRPLMTLFLNLLSCASLATATA